MLLVRLSLTSGKFTILILSGSIVIFNPNDLKIALMFVFCYISPRNFFTKIAYNSSKWLCVKVSNTNPRMVSVNPARIPEITVDRWGLDAIANSNIIEKKIFIISTFLS